MSPASWPDERLLAEPVRVLEGWGLEVGIGRHASAMWGPMAGRDKGRLADVNAAVRDPRVRAIVATRGGMASYRIAHQIDFATLPRDPKPFVAFSDLTNIHLAIAQQCGVPTVHDCAVGQWSAATGRHLLMESSPVTLQLDPASVSAAISRQAASARRSSKVELLGEWP